MLHDTPFHCRKQVGLPRQTPFQASRKPPRNRLAGPGEAAPPRPAPRLYLLYLQAPSQNDRYGTTAAAALLSSLRPQLCRPQPILPDRAHRLTHAET